MNLSFQSNLDWEYKNNAAMFLLLFFNHSDCFSDGLTIIGLKLHQGQQGVELGIMLPGPGSCFLILHQKKGDEEFPDWILRDQTLVAKRLMEKEPKEWQEWVTDKGKVSAHEWGEVEIKGENNAQLSTIITNITMEKV